MKTELNIEYEWFIDHMKGIDLDMIDKLNKHAEEHIDLMRKDGYREGELVYKDEEYSIRGYWSVKKRYPEAISMKSDDLYAITWRIDLYAKSYKNAAEKALEVMRDNKSTAVVFDVKNKSDKTKEIVDLLEF